MAFFLKKSNLKKGLYLQIYESFYDPIKKETAHRSHKAIGYVDTLIASGTPDPVSFYKDVVDKMNDEVKLRKQPEKQISESPEKNLGYFLIKSVLDGLKVSRFFDFFQLKREFRFRISDVIEALVYSRMVEPCSKNKTINEVIPSLFNKYDFSYNQLLDGIEYIGNDYEKVIEIFNHQLNLKYPSDSSLTYFDGTNFYFEIDKEDDIRRKGPSKEHRKDPILGMGLLLDKNQIPLGMKLYPGNQSEMPVIREVIADLKNRNNITGRTIQVADKGLNGTKNILDARKNGDGYIFSKSVKRLPAIEKTWLLLSDGYKDIYNEKELVYKRKECVDKFPYTYEDENGKKMTVMLTEKRVAVFSPKLAKKKKIEITRMVEKAMTLKASKAKKDEYGECSKYVSFVSADQKGNKTNGKVIVLLNDAAIQEDLKIAGYNLFVTSEINMSAEDIYGTYRNLWRIEESFKVMKSYLDVRPVFLQKENAIYGHFLICYICVFLLRVLQFHVLKNKYSTENILSFIENFRVVEFASGKYINLASSSEFIKNISKDLSLPLTNYYFNQSQINKVLSHRIMP